jgi:cell pole-organizing protein PopZ
MNNTAKAHEPTMEEILASIRRIIADDENAQPRPALRAVEPEAPELEDVEDEDTYVTVPDQAAGLTDDLAAFDAAIRNAAENEKAGQETLAAYGFTAASAPVEVEVAPAGPRTPFHAETETLVGAEATRAVASAFGTLSNTIISQNGRTLDDLVQDMLRPMLSDWLDDNLPGIVERLVRAEIERVSRGPRR